MRSNKTLKAAKRAKNDEFYTLLTDIEKEMKYYKEQFKDKVVYCNCDDARESNFFKYFSMNFEHLGLKRLITTSYNANGNGTILVYEGDKNGNKVVDDEEIIVKELSGNGDFRSEECLQILQESDIIVTNPPFSLFREFISIMMQYEKQFCVIGNMNALTYKEIFPYIKNNKLWWGNSIHSGDRQFFVPDNYELNAATCGINENGRKFIRVKGVRWWTNMDFPQRYEELDLIKKYNEEEYPKYDNYDAININKTADIPLDYNGVMGVPITFLDKFCPTQFKLVGAMTTTKVTEDNFGYPYIKGKKIYARVLIQSIK